MQDADAARQRISDAFRRGELDEHSAAVAILALHKPGDHPIAPHPDPKPA